jgi:NitT/TauT family transport system permease protein
MTDRADTSALPRPVARARRTTPRLPGTREHAMLAAIGVASFIAVWELLPALGLVNPLFTSSPSRIAVAARAAAADRLWADILISATEFWTGFLLAVAVGVPLGVFLGWYRRWHALVEPLITMFYTTPRVALLPLLILWLGIGLSSKIAVVFLGAVFPILMNVIAGMRTIDETLLTCARSFGASDLKIFTTLALPGSVPFTLTGLRIGVGRALVGVVVGEMVASSGGLGHMISVAGTTFQTDRVFVGIVIIAVFGYVVTALLNALERRFDAWRPQQT